MIRWIPGLRAALCLRLHHRRNWPALLFSLILPSVLHIYPTAAAPKLTLSEAIARSIVYSPKLKSAQAGIGAAAGTELQTHLWPNPIVGLQGENLTGTGVFSGLRASETTLSASELIELGGKRESRQSAARAGRAVAELDAGTSRLDLIRDVTVAYLEALSASENLKLASDLERTAKAVLSDVTRRVNAARDPLYQKSRAEVAYTTAALARQQASNTSAAARKQLAGYWGADDFTNDLDPVVLSVQAAPDELSDYEARLTDTPDLTRFGRLRDVRAAELRLAQAGAVPDLTVSAGVRRLQGSSDTAFVAGISLPVPLLNQNQGEIARAGAELVRVRRDGEQALVERKRELIAAWTQWRTAWGEAETLKKRSIPEAERAYSLALEGYRLGAFQYLDVLDTQRTLFETRSFYISALTRAQTARASVERLTVHATSEERAP